ARDRLLAPFGELEQGLVYRQLQAQVMAAPRLGQYLHRDFGNYPELAEAGRHQAGQVVACDVLHDFAAKAQQLALTGDDPGAEHQVAHRTRPGPARAGQPGGDHAAHSGLATEGGRLAGQRLALFVQGGKQLDQRRATAHRHYQLGGIVVDDTAVLAGIQYVTGHRAAEKGLAVGALDGQGRVALQGIEDLLQQLLFAG